MIDTLLAQLIARREGFYVEGSLPARDHNPGDLRHSPHSQHSANAPNAIGKIDTDADGWADLEEQLTKCANRKETLAQFVDIYAPPSDHNDTAEYLQFLCTGLGDVPSSMLVSDALKIPGDPANG